MGLGEAIRTCFSKYVTFGGRARRPEYWYWGQDWVSKVRSQGPPRRRVKAAGTVARRSGYEALATPRLSRSTLRLNALTRPSTPSRRTTQLNSERCTARWLILPSR